MELDGARVVVAGATGVLGRALTEALLAAGARVVPAGRDAGRLAELAGLCGTEGLAFDALDTDACRTVVQQAAESLGGLDLLVVATGVAAFGPAMEADDAVVEELFAVDVLAPMALVRAAVPHMESGTVAVLSAVLADLPTAGMAEYSSAKSALATWLEVARRELRRRRIGVLDIRPPHVETGLADRALAGEPPRMPVGYPVERLVEHVLEALRADAREVVYDVDARDLVVR